MKKNIFLLTFIVALAFNVKAQSFDHLFNPAQSSGQISFYNSGTNFGYRISEGALQGNAQLLNFQFLNGLGSSNIMSFHGNSVIIGNPSYTSDKLMVEGSSRFFGNMLIDGSLGVGNLNVSGDAIFNQKVGIGTSNPIEKLHINGAIRGNGVGGSLEIKSDFGSLTVGAQNSVYAHLITDRSQFYFNKPLFIASGIVASYTSSDLKLQTNSTLRMTIKNSNGNVGIGTANPDQKLTVKGNIHSEEVIVDLSVPPDYVFEKYFTGESTLNPNYKMLGLEEIEAFTKVNHHLPNVPSATEIQKDGLKLSEMTGILLQKIEELTLYTIEQEKRIKALESKLESKK
ncbi:hypothetical protein [Aequorivita lipolytica]|uniref:Peptidase S74 domain-containing protein n=1 Tax=Aequorivita lipolytica TaxID=153267 RepID=A0A5C6YSF9_9FLAO|nr:hypothetical protein [Aequorivita lipolytica]TXD69975.1 hypothetical protein ESV24_05955 [Aequorivita lipolytica]SRX50200.1 hypothetical protein AEQU2_00669 [Aequorivita lipolytica]